MHIAPRLVEGSADAVVSLSMRPMTNVAKLQELLVLPVVELPVVELPVVDPVVFEVLLLWLLSLLVPDELDLVEPVCFVEPELPDDEVLSPEPVEPASPSELGPLLLLPQPVTTAPASASTATR